MDNSSVYKSAKSEAVMRALYNHQMERLGLEYEDRMIKTRFGDTHIVITGPRYAAPIVTVHGGNGNTPLNLSLFKPLTTKYRVYALDTIGHPGKSAAVRLPPTEDSYGKWLLDVLDGLGLESIPFVASSYGAGIVLQMAVLGSRRIKGMALCVPSGIAHGPLLPMIFQLLLPWVLYRFSPNRKRLLQAFLPMMTEVNEDFLDFTDAMLRHVKLELRGPRELTRQELMGFTAPTLVIAAHDDIFFPAARVLPRAREILPNVVATECIDGKHLPSKQTLKRVNEIIMAFMNELPA